MAHRFESCSRLAVRTVTLTVLAAAVSAPAEAQRHVRLSGDLADGLKAGAPRLEVILDDAAAAARLAARYNIKITRQLRTGAVLEVNAGQLAALTGDADVTHLSGNARYHSSALGVDPVDEGIGADQVWAGAGGLPKLTGRGVTVA